MKRILTNSRVLLTGASSGIGRALALELAKEGVDMIILARREDRLRELMDEIRSLHNDYTPENGTRKLLTVVGDITDPSVRAQAIELAQNSLGGLDLLINNAGAGATSLFEVTTESTFRGMMEVNYFSIVELTRLALPLLKDSGHSEERKLLSVHPLVVNLSSIVGLCGVPHYGAYGAAKFAVTGLSETMRAEFSKYGIDVLLVCPGTTETEFFDVLHQSDTAPQMPVHVAVSSQYVAQRIVRAMKRGKHKIIPYFQAKILDYLNRFAPGFTQWLMTRYV